MASSTSPLPHAAAQHRRRPGAARRPPRTSGWRRSTISTPRAVEHGGGARAQRRQPVPGRTRRPGSGRRRSASPPRRPERDGAAARAGRAGSRPHHRPARAAPADDERGIRRQRQTKQRAGCRRRLATPPSAALPTRPGPRLEPHLSPVRGRRTLGFATRRPAPAPLRARATSISSAELGRLRQYRDALGRDRQETAVHRHRSRGPSMPSIRTTPASSSCASVSSCPGNTPISPTVVRAKHEIRLARPEPPLDRDELDVHLSHHRSLVGHGQSGTCPRASCGCAPGPRDHRRGRTPAPGTLSNSPLAILSNDSIVSLSGTVEPGWPVNCSATSRFCDRKRSIRRARPTSWRSSSESSSMPRIAMMSCRSV